MKKLTRAERAVLYECLPDPNNFVQFILSLLLMLSCGITVQSMWNWFLMPLGLPAITLPHAIGIDMFVSFVVTTRTPRPDEGGMFWWRFTYGLTISLVTLLIGWLVHFCM